MYTTCVYSLAVVQQRFADFDCETRGFVETIPFCVDRRTGIRVEGDVGPCRRLQRSRFRRRPTRTRVCNQKKKKQTMRKTKLLKTYYLAAAAAAR